MEKISLNRIPFQKDADARLRMLKSRLGVTPNILCRLGFCLSLNVTSEPPAIDEMDKGREINRHTLLGQYDIIFTALLRQWKKNSGSDLHLDELMIRHMNRGTHLLPSILL